VPLRMGYVPVAVEVHDFVTVEREAGAVQQMEAGTPGSARFWVRLAAVGLLVMGFGSVALLTMMMGSHQADPILLLFGPACTIVGYLILTRTDGNRVGLALALIVAALSAAGLASVLDERSDTNEGLVNAIGSTGWFGMFVAIGFLLYWFPTGKPASPGWRWVGWLGVSAALVALANLFSVDVCLSANDDGQCEVWGTNPLGIPGVPNPEYGPGSGVFFAVLVGFVLLSAVSLVVRFIRSRGVERLQLKWVALAAAFIIVVLVVGEIVAIPPPLDDILFGLSLLSLPLAIGASVLRYRLYDIDRIISRSLSYAVLVGMLGATFFGLVTFLSSRVGADNQLVVAGATLAVAALFNPLRRRVQGWVDRRFNRSRYDAERVMDEFAVSLRDRVDPDSVVDGWVSVVSETMEPSAVGVWVRQ